MFQESLKNGFLETRILDIFIDCLWEPANKKIGNKSLMKTKQKNDCNLFSIKADFKPSIFFK